MDVKWLEDFITLAHTKSFSRAASLRCVTQPAFSRRIQALEGWLGCELIDRSVYPTRLSPQGDVFYEQALLMLEQLRQARAVVRGGRPQNAHQVRVIVPHTLACSKMPSWVQTMRDQLFEQVSDLSFQLAASNVHDAVIHFTDGGCDFLACFHHHREPIELDASKFEYKVLGTESFLPFCAKDLAGHPKFNINIPSDQSIPLLSYSKHAYLWRMVDIALSSGPPLNLQPIFETDMSDSLRAMCEQGLGVAWLPQSMGNLSSHLVPLSGIYHTEMEIRLYRRIFKGKELSANPDYLEQVWNVWPQN